MTDYLDRQRRAVESLQGHVDRVRSRGEDPSEDLLKALSLAQREYARELVARAEATTNSHAVSPVDLAWAREFLR